MESYITHTVERLKRNAESFRVTANYSYGAITMPVIRSIPLEYQLEIKASLFIDL
jgi:uncharacterized FlaG/YvyC family protein